MTKKEIVDKILEKYYEKIEVTDNKMWFNCRGVPCADCPANDANCDMWLDNAIHVRLSSNVVIDKDFGIPSSEFKPVFISDIDPNYNSDITVAENGWEKETKKDGKVKTMFQLVDPYFYEGFADILTLGAQKYKPNNWVDGSHDEYSRAVESHWNEYKKGNKLDKESGKSHLYHIACNLMFLDYFDRKEEELEEIKEEVHSYTREL